MKLKIPVSDLSCPSSILTYGMIFILNELTERVKTDSHFLLKCLYLQIFTEFIRF